MTLGWISFTAAELAVLSDLLGYPSPWPRPDALTSMTPAERDTALADAAAGLRARGAMHPLDPEVALPVAELLRLVARAAIDVSIVLSGPHVSPDRRAIRLTGNGRAIVEMARDGNGLRFTPFSAGDLLPRLVKLVGLDVRERPGGHGFTTSLSVLDQCKDAAEAGQPERAVSILRAAGVDDADAQSFGRALTSIEQSVAVRVTVRTAGKRTGVELFWLDAPEQRWALPSILSPFARSAAERRSGPVDDARSWTVDPVSTMLTVVPTDGDELMSAVHDAIVAAAGRSVA